ncbi:MAG: helix-turn-helix domain-containing protein [Bacteroidota bacterium]
MHRCKHTFIFALLLCSSLIAKGQSAYVSRLKDAAALLPSKAVQTDSLCKIILEEIGAKQPSNDSLFVLTYSLLGNSNMYQGKLNLVTVNNLVELKIRQHNYTEARQLLQENIGLCEQKGFVEALSVAHLLAGQCEIESGGNLGAAALSLEKSRELANKTGRKDYLRNIREAELLLQARAGNFAGVKKALEDYKLMNDELAQESARILNSEFHTIYEVKKITQQKDLLEEGISIRNRQLILSLLALFAAVLAVGIIASQHIRLRRTMKTMYRMNVELANNAVISTGSLNSDTVSDDSEENNGEERISLSNLYTETLRRIERDKLYLDPVFSLQELGELMNRSPRYVSQALGEIGKVSFPNLVNNFRINEARRLIANNPDITVIELMEKTGFGSWQSFNRNFKTATGFTPSEYQQRARDTQA